MKIIEMFSESKNKSEFENEDSVYYNNDFCVLVDGATSKTKKRYNGKTSGKLASEIIVNVFKKSQVPSDISAEDAVEYIMQQLREYSVINNIDSDDRLCASALVYSKFKQQVWSIGDCQCMINGVLFTQQKKIDVLMGELRSVIIRCFLLKGCSESYLMKNDLSRSMINEFLLMQRFLENTEDEYGYPVLSSHGSVPKAVIYDVRKGDKVIFASDGYPVVCDTLLQSEELLQSIIHEDPLLFKQFKATKGVVGDNVSFDDRSYLKFVVE